MRSARRMPPTFRPSVLPSFRLSVLPSVRLSVLASPRPNLYLLAAGCILALCGVPAARARPVGPMAQDSARSTRSGVYTADQATRGRELYALSCVSCHSAVSHTGPAFVAKWEGRPLSDLYEFIRGAMPKNEPGSLSRREYTLVLAYLLQMNRMPAGKAELPGDSTALGRIRIELKVSGDSSDRR